MTFQSLLKKLIIPTSIFLGITFFGSGMAKLYFEHKYFGWIGPVWLEDKLTPYGLGLYARFIAYSQVIIGYLLLTLRFRTLGSVMVIPLIANILMVTISLQWQGTPFVVGILLMMALFLIYSDRKKLFPLIGIASDYQPNDPWSWKANLIWILGLFLNLASIQISSFNLLFAWSVSIIGIGFSFGSHFVEKDSSN